MTYPLRFASPETTRRFEQSIRKQQQDVLETSLRRVAAKVAREIVFYRVAMPATVPAWAQAIADDRTVTNLRTVLMGAYLDHITSDAEHATAHREVRPFCHACIARETL
jgi:hypothetical protein